MFGQRLELIVRHYKTDWWGEREVVWRDAAPYPDAAPLVEALHLLLQNEYAGTVTVVNPFGAVLSQNKLTLALMWEAQEHFSPLARRWIRRYIPATYRLTQLDPDMLLAQRQAWVLKSAYGCEGEETICGPYVSDAAWRDAVTGALPLLGGAALFPRCCDARWWRAQLWRLCGGGAQRWVFHARRHDRHRRVCNDRSHVHCQGLRREGGMEGEQHGTISTTREWWQAVDRRTFGKGALAFTALLSMSGCKGEEVVDAESLDVQRKHGWNVGAAESRLFFVGVSEQDATGSTSWQQYTDPSRLMDVWRPRTETWQPFFDPTLIQAPGHLAP